MRIKEINEAHNLLTEWVEWYIRHIETSSIGYPRQTVEAKLREYGAIPSGNPAQSICPEVIITSRISKIDRILSSMPQQLITVIRYKYIVPAQNEAERTAMYMQVTQASRAQYYKQIDEALAWVAGALGANT